MKKTVLFALITVLTLSVLLSGCAFAWDEEGENQSIAKIERIVDNDGVVYMEIHYVNSDEVDRFVLPEGNGIVDTAHRFNETEKVTEITLFYENGDQALVKVPFGKDGKDGASMNLVKLTHDLNGVPFLVFYSEDSEGLLTEQGKIDISLMKGSDGRGIEKWEPFTDDIGMGVNITLTGESGSSSYYFTYFKNITMELEGHEYVITISDGNPQSSSTVFRVTRMPTWLKGDTLPDDERDGIAGDFYYDSRRQIIYTKVGEDPEDVTKGYWMEVARLQREEQEFCSVTFDAGKGSIPGYEAYETAEGYLFDKIPYGKYFLDKYPKIPVPVLEGYTFLGWYRSFETGIGEVPFNDFVQVCSDMKLYAKWQKN